MLLSTSVSIVIALLMAMFALIVEFELYCYSLSNDLVK